MQTNSPDCPCGSTKLYSDCCKIAHHNISQVKTAEALMRSRYTAFVIANGDYIIKSHHSITRPKSKKEKNEIVAWAKSVQWIKLEVLKTSKGLETDTEGTVKFKAYFFENNNVRTIEENSHFLKENDCWMYVGEAN
jgi:SEC-C motif-containing protein